ncbi:tyrosine protein kinase [Annulohypoxylon maeteangense]|uniref:tyrosine protein kinase n=1 Tax=Annulohypoxylon maeteangense TaxID=1927788 RepID=UPI002008BF2F|nr:tyrosine protein kinase [Annulohypoxylon maeteangense]KAI0880274.1 tyrosine protein kinase [Annulohypoxylon maeteangense]
MAADSPPRPPNQDNSPSRGGEHEQQFPLPAILTYPSSTPPSLITQGAEARLYKTTYLLPSIPAALKYRPPKPWRHPILDARLTRHRILAEARILVKSRREGVPVPAVYAVDETAGWMMMEWVKGVPARVGINEWLRRRKETEKTTSGDVNNTEDENDGDAAPITGDGEEDKDLVALMRRIGSAVGRMHKVGIVHGDLTTSNMMLRPWGKGREPANGHASGGDGLLDGDIIIIDFGLASQSSSDEDRAVDLYVLERAFASTHSRAEKLFSATLESSYKEAFKQAPVVIKKLEEVRMRGRKRSMIG